MERNEIVRSPSALAAYDLLGKELPGDFRTRLKEEILPQFEEVQQRLMSLRDEIRAYRESINHRND